MARVEPTPHLHLDLVGRGEAGVTALRRQEHVAPLAAGQGRHAEAGAGPQHHHRAIVRPAAHRLAQRSQFVSVETRAGQGLGGEVIDQLDRLELEGGQEVALRDLPVEVGELDLAVQHRPGHGDHRARRPAAAHRGLQVAVHDVGERAEVAVVVDLRVADVALRIDEGQARMGAADVADEAVEDRLHQAASNRLQAPASAGPAAWRIQPNISRP